MIFKLNPTTQSIKSKNNVKFKEVKEYGKEEGSVLSAEELKVNNNPEQEKNSNEKLTSILKKSNQDKNSDIPHESSVKLSQHLNDTLEKEEMMNENESNAKSKRVKDTISNMKIEEDHVNLSDLGIGPEKPTIKTIYKKTIIKKQLKPVRDPSKVVVSPESSKNHDSKRNIISPQKKARGKLDDEEGYDSNQDSEGINLLDNSKIMMYEPLSDIIGQA